MISILRHRVKHTLLDRWQLPHSPYAGVSPALYRKFRSKTSISLVDVGAHNGTFTKAVLQMCQISSAVLIEPIERFALELRADPELTGFHVFDCLAGADDGTHELKIYEDFPYISSTLAVNDSLIAVSKAVVSRAAKMEPRIVERPIRKLDTIVAEANDLGTIDLLKIDVQGFEDQVLAGAAHTLARTLSVFIEASFRPLYVGSAVFSDVYDLMIAHGFHLTDVEPAYRGNNSELLQVDLMFERSSTTDESAGVK